MSTPKVSIVLCTRNRAQLLGDALGSLTALEAGAFEYEVIVVNNGSSDNTAKVVADIASRSVISVRHVLEPRPGIAFARNCGVKESRGEWIAFFDDDQLADPRWLIELLAMAEAKNARCVGGAVHLNLPGSHCRELSPFCRKLLGETVGMPDRRRYSSTVTPGTGNLMLHRSIFYEVGLFDETLNTRGEDTDLFMRLHVRGIDAWYTPAAVVLHVIPPERLREEYLLTMTRLTVMGMAENDRNHWGRVLFPVVWAARSAQALFVLAPRLAWARLRHDYERTLGAQCRLSLAMGYLIDGLELIVPVLRRGTDI